MSDETFNTLTSVRRVPDLFALVLDDRTEYFKLERDISEKLGGKGREIAFTITDPPPPPEGQFSVYVRLRGNSHDRRKQRRSLQRWWLRWTQ